MSTANDIITPALMSIGAHTGILPADPSIFEQARKRLYALLQELESKGIELGTADDPVVLPTTLATEMNEKPGADQHLVDVLAARVCGIARAPKTPDIVMASRRGYIGLRSQFGNGNIENIVPSRLMPIGQGSQTGPNSRTFFNGSPLDADTTTDTD